jgi:uncharacterized membrane protein
VGDQVGKIRDVVVTARLTGRAPSVLGFVAAPLILLAQNRQADRDRVQFHKDRDHTERLLADTDYLTREIASLRLALGEVVTRDYLRGEIRDLLEEFKDIQNADKKDDPETS